MTSCYLDMFGLEDDAVSSFSNPTQNIVLVHIHQGVWILDYRS